MDSATKSAMKGARRNRRTLLPMALVLAALGLAVQHAAFVPAPPRYASPPATAEVNPTLAITAAAAVLGGIAADPAVAVGTDSPMAHGTIGDIDIGVLQGIFEKCTFGGLLASTALSWWKGTLGAGRAQQQEAGGRPFSFWAMCFSNLSLVALLSSRWYESGHFPLSNMYESLMFLAWGVTAVTLFYGVSEEKPVEVTPEGRAPSAATSEIATVWSSPVALCVVAFATLTLPKELQKASALVPALKSNWLVMHVSVVMLSYSTLMFGSVLCMAVLALAAPKDSPITAIRQAVVPALQGIASGLTPNGPVAATSPQLSEQEAAAVMATSTTGPAPTDAVAKPSAMTASSGVASAQFATANGDVSVEFTGSSGVAKNLTEDDKLSLTLDDLAYRSLLLGFGFLTIGIVSGAVWANEAWGNYWSWDPKETWSLITWFVYAGYLHTRLQLGWDTRDSAKIGALGFFVVWVCYIGVNLMGLGLHSYGFFLK